MTPESERLVRDSWERLRSEDTELVEVFYDHLFAINPGLRHLFASTSMELQRTKFTVMITEIVSALGDPAQLVRTVAPSGRRHVQYGVKPSDYDDVGAALLWAIGSVLGAEFTPELKSAWREAYTLLSAVMKRAGEQEQRGIPVRP